MKVFGQAFFKRLAVSKGGALVALRRVRNFLFRRALRKGLNLQNDPVDRFAKRGNPAREGSPLLADFADYPFTKQVKTAYLDLVSSRLSASQSLLCDLVCTPIRRRLPFARAKGSKTRSGEPRDPTHRNTPARNGCAVPKRGLNGAYKGLWAHLPPSPPLPRSGGGGSCPTFCLS